MAYKYGDRVIVNGKDVGEARFDSATGKALSAPSIPVPESNTQIGGGTSDFMKAIQDKLLGQSSVISSTNSGLEQRINAAIAGVNQARDASGKAIESSYNREADFQSGQAALGAQTHLEGRVGFATQMVAFRNFVETSDKSLKDLEMRKNELLLQNDAQAASKISELQMQAIQFRQKAEQETFSNLLGMANFGVNSATEARLAKAQTFTENKAMSDIALQYGLDIKNGDTLDSITSKAMVFASEEQKARLAKIKSETARNNADAAKILSGTTVDANAVKITPEITSKLAARWTELAKRGATVDTSAEMENILGKYAKTGKEAEFYDAIAEITVESAKAQLEAQKATQVSNGQRSLVKDVVPFGKSVQNTSAGFLNYLLGKDVFEKI